MELSGSGYLMGYNPRYASYSQRYSRPQVNPYILLTALALLATGGIYGTWERGQAEHWKAQYSILQASYNSAALKAQQDAAKQEQQDEADNKKRAQDAIQEATDAKDKADKAKLAYEIKLKAASGEKDLPHQCSGVAIPAGLIP